MENQNDRLPPQALDIEQAFLGALLIDGDQFESISTMLPTEAFYSSDNKKVFEAMHRIYQKGGKIDLLTVAEQGCSPKYLSNLLSRVGSAAHMKYHLAIIYDKWVARECIRIGTELIEQSYVTDDILDTLQLVRSKMDDRLLQFLGITSTGISIIDAANKSLDDYYKRELARRDGKYSGIPTTLPSLNRITGGLQKQQLIILAARPGMGKTSLAISFLMEAARFNFKCAMFSLEMTSERLMDKVICSLANISHSDYKSGRLMDQQKKAAEDSLGIINHWSVTLNDQMVVDIDKVHAMCRKIKDVKGLDLVVIDYLQLLRTKDRVGNREQEISNISRKAKMLAVDLNIPVLLLSQLNRGLEQRSDKRPMLSDLRESGAIEQDADVVLFIYRDYEYHENAPPDAGELIIAKHREGERGIIDFKFNMEMTRFSEEEDLDMDMYINESKPF